MPDEPLFEEELQRMFQWSSQSHAMFDQGRLEAAAEASRAAYAIAKRLLPSADQRRIACAVNLADVHLSSKDHLLAEQLMLEVDGELSEVPDVDPSTRQQVRNLLANLYIRTGRYDDAEGVIDRSITELSTIDPYDPLLVSNWHVLGLVYVVTQRAGLVPRLLECMAEVRSRLAPEHASHAEIEGATAGLERLVEAAANASRQASSAPNAQAEGDEAACWRSFIVRDWGECARQAQKLRDKANPRIELMRLVSLRGLGVDLDADELQSMYAAVAWLRDMAAFVFGHQAIDVPLASAPIEQVRCAVWFFGGMLALQVRDEAAARIRFQRATDCEHETADRRQASIELEALGLLAVADSAVPEALRDRQEEAEKAFAVHDLAAFLLRAHELLQQHPGTPRLLLLQVAGYMLIGQPDIALSVAGYGRKQLLHWPWHVRLLDLLEGKESHHRLLREAGNDPVAATMVGYYAMLRLQATGRWAEAIAWRNRILLDPSACPECGLAALEATEVVACAQNLRSLAKRLSDAGHAQLAERAQRAGLDRTKGDARVPRRLIAQSEMNLAAILCANGRYAESIVCIERAQVHASELTRQESAIADLNAGQIFMEIGATAEAYRLLSRSAEVLGDEETADPEVELAPALFNALGHLAQTRGAPDKALGFFKAALERFESAKVGSAQTHAALLDNLAGCHAIAGHHNLALPIYWRSRALIEARLVSGGGHLHAQHDTVMKNLSNLASCLLNTGETTKARTLALEGLEAARSASATAHGNVYNLEIVLAGIAAVEQQFEEALERMLAATQESDELLSELMALGGDELRMNYVSYAQFDVAALVTLASEHFAGQPGQLERVFDVVLRRKGLAGEAAAVQRDTVWGGRYPLLKEPLAQLAEARGQLAAAALAEGRGDNDGDAVSRLTTLRQRVRALEATLAQEIPELRLGERLRNTTARRVIQAMREPASLIEIVRSMPLRLGDHKRMRASVGEGAHYYAFVVPDADLERLALVDLGLASAIDPLVDNFLRTQHGAGTLRDFDSDTAPDDADVADSSGKLLREALYDPLAEMLGGSLVVAADGELARIPWEVLPVGRAELLADRHQISYLGTARDLLAIPSKGARGGPAVVAADPDFDLGRTSAAQPDAESPFARLPGTRREGLAVAAMLGVEAWLGPDVLEARIRQLSSPLILHLATHGFFSTDRDEGSDLPSQAMRGWRVAALQVGASGDPMLRSGLALAGANASLRGEPLAADAGDGVLTASEVLTLDLRGTELVVLSACDTGLGTIARSEGVMGLRRAFLLAGARSVLVSLWKVPDEPTCELMQLFYRKLLRGASRVNALRTAQAELRRIWPSPRIWGAFVCFGETGPLLQRRRTPDDVAGMAGVHLRACLSFFAQGREPQALEAFHAAVSVDAPTPMLLVHLARAFNRPGGMTLAISLLDSAIALDAREAEAWHLRGYLHAALGQLDDADRDYSRAIELDPAQQVFWYDRGTMRADQRQDALAIQDFTRAIDMDPGDSQSWVNRATVYMACGEFASALSDLVEAVRLDPDDEIAHFNLGQVHLLMGSNAKAVAELAPFARGEGRLGEPARNLLQQLHAIGETPADVGTHELVWTHLPGHGPDPKT